MCFPLNSHVVRRTLTLTHILYMQRKEKKVQEENKKKAENVEGEVNQNCYVLLLSTLGWQMCLFWRQCEKRHKQTKLWCLMCVQIEMFVFLSDTKTLQLSRFFCAADKTIVKNCCSRCLVSENVWRLKDVFPRFFLKANFLHH